jgi:hypothetical protein
MSIAVGIAHTAYIAFVWLGTGICGMLSVNPKINFWIP